MSGEDQRRLRVLAEVEAGTLACWEAAAALGLTTRQLRVIRKRVRADGVSGVAHRNRGRVPVNRCDGALAARVVHLFQTKYAGFNQAFFTEMMEREEGILLSRSTVRRILATAGIGAVKPQKRSRHRRHRVRRAQEGAMVQMDGSDHDWLGDRGPRLTLVGGIDDATSNVWAVFRYEEDLGGYFELFMKMVSDKGIPGSVYVDETTIFLGKRYTEERIRTGTTAIPTQLTRLLDKLDIVLIQARSPQAKGRVERLWRTLQDRLLCELRAKDICTLAGAQRVLQYHLAFHNRNFGVDAADPVPAWRPPPLGMVLADTICWIHSRVVTNANTVSVAGTKLQLEFPRAHPGWARRRVEVCRRLDGSWFARAFNETVPATPITGQPLQQRVAA